MKPSTCRAKTRQAVREGKLTVPDACEVCGITRDQILLEQHRFSLVLQELYGIEAPPRKVFFVAHHWHGYDYPLDVWWVCSICNYLLIGKHDGSLTLEQARELARQNPRKRF